VFLWQYAAGIRSLQNGGGLPALENALTRQKSLWKYVGLLMIVMIALYLTGIVAGGMAGVLLGRH